MKVVPIRYEADQVLKSEVTRDILSFINEQGPSYASEIARECDRDRGNEHYKDNHGLWRDFCQQVFGYPELTGEDIANVPDSLPSMKYNVIHYYQVVFEDEIEGPFLDKDKAREVAQGEN